MKRYRVVEQTPGRFWVETRSLLWPFWYDLYDHACDTAEEAIREIERHKARAEYKPRVVYVDGESPRKTMEDYQQMIDDCEARESKLSEWEASFIDSIAKQLRDRPNSLSAKQIATLDKIWEKVTA